MNTVNKENTKKKKRSTFAILFYINRTKIRRDGMCQLLCRLSIDGENEQIGTKVSVNPAIWEPGEGESGGRAAGKSRNALEVNKAIGLLTGKINGHYNRILESQGFVTAELVKNALKGVAQKPVTLMKLFEEHNEEFKKRVGVDRKKEAYDIYVVSYNHLLAFIRKQYDADDVSLRSLDLNFYEAYDLFLRTDRGLQQKTVHQHLYNFKKITKRAFNQGTLRRDPYMKLFPELPPLKSRHLKLEDLEKLMRHRFNRPNLCLARDMFVFRHSQDCVTPTLPGCPTSISYRQRTAACGLRLKGRRPARIPVSACWKSRCKLWRNTARRKKTSTYFMFTAVVIWANCYARSPGYAVRATSPFTRPGIISERISRSLRVFPSKPLAG